MSYKLPKESIVQAIQHLIHFGDTDVFPHLHELSFVAGNAEEIAEIISNIDILAYENRGGFEALAPKSRLGFRLCHQLPLLDNVLLLAAVIEIGSRIEESRGPLGLKGAFSYRFQVDANGSIFRPDHTFKNWLHGQAEELRANLKYKQVAATDISDFYARVNFHRLENLLEEVAPGHGAVSFIRREIKAIRAKQSFGLPVGGAAARLLAELALTDVDRELARQGIFHTRFVDDFRLFLLDGQDAYDSVSLLAGLLGITEGLSLNSSKTKVYTRTEYIQHLQTSVGDIRDEAEGAAVEQLTSSLYFDDQPDPDELARLANVNLLLMLQSELDKPELDFGRVKVIFRALKIVKPVEAIEYIIGNISELVIFAKEVVLLIEALIGEHGHVFNDIALDVARLVVSPPASTVQVIKSWLLELFSRGLLPISDEIYGIISVNPSVMDGKQLILIRSRNEDRTYFRTGKSGFEELNLSHVPAFLVGATVLPRDEFKNLAPTVYAFGNADIGTLFLSWVRQNRTGIIDMYTRPPARP